MKRMRYKSKATEGDYSLHEYHSEANLPYTRKRALELPSLPKKIFFTDQTSVSQDYVKISHATKPERKSSQPNTARPPHVTTNRRRDSSP